MTNPKIAIIGGGLAGLSAAKVLNETNLEVTLFESQDCLGGRVQSRKIDGFILDEGFQVFNPSYPTARKLLEYERLGLRSFEAGVTVMFDESEFVLTNPLRSPNLIPSFLKNMRHLNDMTRFGAYALSRIKSSNVDSQETAYEALRDAGISETFIWQVLNPFLQGVFLNSTLSSSKDFLDFVLRYFLLGKPTLPMLGMGQIPLTLASTLSLTDIRLNTRVEKIDEHTLVTSDGNETFDKIIVATDSNFVRKHFGVNTPDFYNVTTWYHTTDLARNQLAQGRGLLRVDSDSSRGPIINTVVLSHVASTYSPAGKLLISSSTLSSDCSKEMEIQVRRHLSQLYRINTSNWDLVEAIHVPFALNMSSQQSAPQKINSHTYLAGDWTTNTSIDGAMASGVRAATSLLHDLGSTR